MYEFSLPMPYTNEDIKKLLDLNNQVEKSSITSLFFSLPSNSEFYSGFEQNRNKVYKHNWDYWKTLILNCLEKKVDFIYLLNNPTRLPIESKDFEKRLDKLDNLLTELKKLGVKKLRIAEHKLMSYISEQYPYFTLYASTSFELKSIAEYRNFMYMHPLVKQIVPSHDSIKDFNLLKNLKKVLPNVEIELMVNEGCFRGCPNRFGHAAENMDYFICHKNSLNLSNKYYLELFCQNLEINMPVFSLVNSNLIYPWEIEEYSKIGINKFKMVGRDMFIYKEYNWLKNYYMYLKGIDNIKNIENEPITTFNHHFNTDFVLKQLTVKDVIKYLPGINHFKKYGNLCASICGVECNYCFKCTERIQKTFFNKSKNNKIPICVMPTQGKGVINV